MVTFDTHPDRYAHWRLNVEGPVATLTLDVDEDRGLRPGYKLKLNSYDLGVDIELADALQRLRFEHPAVRCLVLTSGKERMFCSGANIYMLGQSSHAWKVNFCKFTNETRNSFEDASRHSGLKSIAALNGTTAGGGYELALACDEILMVDDRSSTISLPEVPLLGVLPGTGGLTRLVDKRKVRRDLADVFCTTIEGVRADRAIEWGLVDVTAKPKQFADALARRTSALASAGGIQVGDNENGIVLGALQRRVDANGLHYPNLDVVFDRAARNATFTLRVPSALGPDHPRAIVAAGDRRRSRNARRTLAGSRNHRTVAAHVIAAGCFVTQCLRADRSRLVLRGHLVRARVSRRSQLHARTSRRDRTRTCGRIAAGDRAVADEWRRLSNGARQDAARESLLRRDTAPEFHGRTLGGARGARRRLGDRYAGRYRLG